MTEEDTERRSEKLKALRRRVAEDWVDGPGKERALCVLDEMIFEIVDPDDDQPTDQRLV